MLSIGQYQITSKNNVVLIDKKVGEHSLPYTSFIMASPIKKLDIYSEQKQVISVTLINGLMALFSPVTKIITVAFTPSTLQSIEYMQSQDAIVEFLATGDLPNAMRNLTLKQQVIAHTLLEKGVPSENATESSALIILRDIHCVLSKFLKEREEQC